MASIQCFAPKCTNDASDVAPCDGCHLARYCSDECRVHHKATVCNALRNSTVHQMVAELLSRVQKKGWVATVAQTLAISSEEASGSWTAAFVLARTVGGYEAVEVLAAKRMNMEAMLIGQRWDENDVTELRQHCVNRCATMLKVKRPIPLFGWIMPGENYMHEAPHREETVSYDHVFAVVPLFGEQGHLILLQWNDGAFRATLVESMPFWIAVRAVVSAKVWTKSIGTCYERAFGVQRDFTGRTIAPMFDASPLLPSLCAQCNTPTAPNHCERCKRVTYCNRQCQTQHWKHGHKNECRSVSIDTV